MNQKWENGEKTNLTPDFGRFAQTWAPKFFPLVLSPLDIVANYIWMQFQGKLMIQTQENSKKTHSGLI